MKADKISELTTNRLSIYLRCLNELAVSGRKTVSSSALAREFHLNSAQIRKDLANFGEFGVRGVGYYIDSLREHLTKILGLNKPHNVCIIGAGRLGTALADYHGFRRSNFRVAALFDTDRRKIGKKVGGIPIFDLKNFSSVVKRDKIEVAVIAVPATQAQKVLDKVAKAGIKAVLNFAPAPLKVSDEIRLKTVDLTSSLESLSYFLAGDPEAGGELKPKAKNRRNKQQ
ncbi:MAG TPA: redox-sensing transcriptional repressor Rex [Pyrinomonadaceae bacterium]|nr:redox-sensing transcriptional repressor Rex [Pyrinomonadaceae bacterium]HMP66704.1 redox-sensing transcriptional repressor Rex [Pyrinomonadaceae bacterium]